MKLWAGRPKDASGNKVAPVEIPTEAPLKDVPKVAPKATQKRTPKGK